MGFDKKYCFLIHFNYISKNKKNINLKGDLWTATRNEISKSAIAVTNPARERVTAVIVSVII